MHANVFLLQQMTGRTVIPRQALRQGPTSVQAGSWDALASWPSPGGPVLPPRRPLHLPGGPGWSTAALHVAPITAASGTRGTQAPQKPAYAWQVPSPLPGTRLQRPQASACVCTPQPCLSSLPHSALLPCHTSLIKRPSSQIKIIQGHPGGSVQ